ncbi:hypothetical protein Pan1_39 [Pseudanabaena phage Pan1]|nr:hypothetical protein Pan1_39 [Pseudanabaena phage Pan1]
MTPAEFKNKQSALGWTNQKMATHLRKSAQTISNYRNGRQTIPEHVEVLLVTALERLHSVPPGTAPTRIGPVSRKPGA